MRRRLRFELLEGDVVVAERQQRLLLEGHLLESRPKRD